MSERLLLGHGGGGTLMQQLIERELRPLLADPDAPLHDAARLTLPHGRLAFSTDGTVVQPLVFAGGDAGRLAVIGTCNDLAMAGARPLWLSLGLILEEGLELALLRRLLASLAQAAAACGVQLATGDTKVVERGKGDGAFLTTSGIGLLEVDEPIDPGAIAAGDQLVVSGDLGRHGVAILAARHGLELEPAVLSDCAPLWPPVRELLRRGVCPHCLRDLTRGGLAAVLHEFAQASGHTLRIDEHCIPLAPEVARAAELLGLDPLELACEGRFLAVLPLADLQPALQLLEPAGGRRIGHVEHGGGRVLLRTTLGSERLMIPPSGELLPRIC
ncbi:MAG: hydrogenase expression/formation protein HypE [Cyanobium sp.]